jgi:hypothetical protein
VPALIEPSLFLPRPEAVPGSAARVVYLQEPPQTARAALEPRTKKAPRVAWGHWVVRVRLQPSEDKISKIKPGQTICQKGYSQKAIPPEPLKGLFPFSPLHGPLSS